MSDQQDPGPTHTPYGQPDPYGQGSAGQPSPYGQQPAWGAPQPTGDRRPGTVTAAAWIAIVFSAITAAIFGFAALALLVARDQVIDEMERVPEFQDANIDPDTAVGALVAVMLFLLLWAVIAVVLAVFVLRRSNVARILLVISSAVVGLFSLLSITSGISFLLLLAAAAVIVLLFVGGAGEWFKRLPSYGAGYPGYPADPYGGQSPYGSQPTYGAPSPYGSQPTYPPPGQQPGQQAGQQGYPSQSPNPYGQTPGSDAGPAAPSGENPYGQPDPYGQTNPYGQQPPDQQDQSGR